MTVCSVRLLSAETNETNNVVKLLLF